MTAVYTAPHYTFQEARGSGLLRLAAKYEFLRVVRAECGQRVYNTSSGERSLRSLRSLGSDMMLQCSAVGCAAERAGAALQPAALHHNQHTHCSIVCWLI